MQTGSDASTAALRDTLESLNAGLDDIVERWRYAVRGEVEVQLAYMRERQLHTPAYLALPVKIALLPLERNGFCGSTSS